MFNHIFGHFVTHIRSKSTHHSKEAVFCRQSLFLLFLFLLQATFADRTRRVLLQPSPNAFGMEYMLAGQAQTFLTLLEITIANNTHFLFTLTFLPRLVVGNREFFNFSFGQPFLLHSQAFTGQNLNQVVQTIHQQYSFSSGLNHSSHFKRSRTRKIVHHEKIYQLKGLISVQSHRWRKRKSSTNIVFFPFVEFLLSLFRLLLLGWANDLVLAHEGSGEFLVAFWTLLFPMLTPVGMSIKLSKCLKIATKMTRNCLDLILVGGILEGFRIVKYSLRLSGLAHTTDSIAPTLMNEEVSGLDIPATFFAESIGLAGFTIHSGLCIINQIIEENRIEGMYIDQTDRCQTKGRAGAIAEKGMQNIKIQQRVKYYKELKVRIRYRVQGS